MFDVYLIANALIILTIFTIVVSSFKNVQCCLALFFSLFSARYLTAIGQTDLHYFAMFISAAISVITIKDWKLDFLEMEKCEVNYAVSFIYMVRVFFGAIYIGLNYFGLAGVVAIEVLWFLSAIMLLIQNLLVLGGCLNGYSKRFNITITNFRFRADALFFSREGLRD